ncbi:MULTISPECIES: hypothetical protein [unclassified Pseudoalteromonas]|uniref:hypothetical protein n=1 Tax=unclassified Pseudoalteromonas TaxID=194690 RepID=UPI001B3A22A5|nr:MULTISPECIES: hypothetical protein [unclassified Pseudoalteromonas]MBQ4848198.1 hypothetical protein [Pseudoalteromonas sp. MMG005]MBQ4851596.1 hypothetical protein [Pseudoalteromonas sp. MMG012]
MNWLLVLGAVMLVMASLLYWQGKRKRLKKRVWRQVQVNNLIKVKQHKTGPMEMLSEQSLLVEFTFLEKQYSCQTAYRTQLCDSFSANEPTFILIDPDNPTQCYYNACQQTKFAKLWFIMSLGVVLCVLLSNTLPIIR